MIMRPISMDKPWSHKLSRWKVASLVLLLLLVVLLTGSHYMPTYSGTLVHQTLALYQNQSGTTDADQDATNRSDHIRYKHTNRYLPQCIIIGSRKAGTRALLNFLNLHPDILAAKSEMHYFDMIENYNRGLEWYRKKMPYTFPGQITIEKTPGYFVVPEAPQRIYEMNSTVKLLLIVRDPTVRAVSDYLQLHLKQVAKYGHGPSFEELAIRPGTGKVDTTYQPLVRSLYDVHMSRWLKYFPREQFHIVNGEKLVEDPFSEIREVERFLGIDHRITEDMFYYNETRKFFCFRWNSSSSKCLNSRKGRQHPDVDPEVIRKLREFYALHNQRFYLQVQQDFGWPEQ